MGLTTWEKAPDGITLFWATYWQDSKSHAFAVIR